MYDLLDAEAEYYERIEADYASWQSRIIADAGFFRLADEVEASGSADVAEEAAAFISGTLRSCPQWCR